MPNLNPRICRACGASFMGGPRAWYCPGCRQERRAEADRLSKVRQRAGKARSIGSVDQCVVCGKDYEVRNGKQRYCPQCAPEAIRKIDAQQGLDYYKTNKETINPARYAKRHVTDETRKKGICVLCSKEFAKYANGMSCPDCREAFRKLSMACSEAKRRKIK